MIVYCAYLCSSYINEVQATMLKSRDNIVRLPFKSTLAIQKCPYAKLLFPQDTSQIKAELSFYVEIRVNCCFTI